MRRLIPMTLLFLVACSTQEPEEEAARFFLRAVSGDGQQAMVTETLAEPLVFRLEDQHGTGESGLTVNFILTRGQGSLDPASAVTDGEGLVETVLTLGTLAGALLIEPEVEMEQPEDLELVETMSATALPGEPASLVWTGGDGQKDAPGVTLLKALSLSVLDEFGNGIADLATTALASEGSAVSPASQSTGADGAAHYAWTLGGEMGAYALTGSSAGFDDAAATAEADSAPSLAYFNPQQPLEAGDTVWVYGENFCEAPEHNDLRLGGAAMEVVAATETQLTARLPAGLDAGLHALTLSVGSQQAPEQLEAEIALALGSVEDYPAVNGEAVLPLATSSSGPQFLVALYSLNTSGPYQVQGFSLDVPSPGLAGARPSGDAFHDFHARLLQVPKLPPGEAARPRAAGDRRSFDVLSDVYGSTADPNSYTQISATRRYSGNRVEIFVDERDYNAQFQPYLNELGAFFDGTVWDVDTQAFGLPTDFDGNGKVLALLTREVNDLTPFPGEDPSWPEGAYIAGFFNPADLDIWSWPEACTNHAEIFYGLVPDPAGEFSPAQHALEESFEILAPIFAHEFQHMINMGQRHYYVGTWQTPLEELWLNEGLSHLAENLCDFDEQNRRRVSLYLHSRAHRFWALGSLAGVEPEVGNDLAERGAEFLFCRYLEDRWPGASRLLTQSTVSGRANVERLTGEPYEQTFKDFIAALYLDGRGLTADPRFEFTSLDIRHDFPYDGGGDEPLAIPDYDLDALPAGLSASVVPSSFDYFIFNGPAPAGEISLVLQAAPSARAGALVIRIGH